ncbi:MAG: response regulator [Phycisphaeraceae bacterium]
MHQNAASGGVASGEAVAEMMSEGQPIDLKRILIAEDEHLVAAALADSLTTLGYEVVGPVADGEQVVALAREQQPQLALLDIRMPRMDGLDAAAELNEMHIPVVIVSAYSDPEYLSRGANLGVFGYVLKPVTVEDLRVNIAVAWSRFRQQHQLRDEVQGLKMALENRKLVERAKGLLMTRLNITEPEAMKRLQKQARDSRRNMADLARAIIETDQLFGEQG